MTDRAQELSDEAKEMTNDIIEQLRGRAETIQSNTLKDAQRLLSLYNDKQKQNATKQRLIDKEQELCARETVVGKREREVGERERHVGERERAVEVREGEVEEREREAAIPLSLESGWQKTETSSPLSPEL